MRDIISASLIGHSAATGITVGRDFGRAYAFTVPERRDSLENILEFPGGRLEIHKAFPKEHEQNLSTLFGDNYLIDMSLSRRPATWTCAGARHGGDAALGRIFLVPPGETIRIAMPQGRLRTIRCLLDGNLIDPFIARDVVWNRKALRDALQLGGGQIEWLMWRMYRELQKIEIGSIQIIEGLAKQLAVEIIRRFNPCPNGASRHAGGLAPWRLRLIEKRVNEDSRLPSIRELAQLCDMSVRHLSRAFRTETGQTLGKYIEAVMAERAHAMLIEGVPVSWIAQTLGYSRTGNFSHAFRRATGLLPTEVKRLRPSCAASTTG